MRRFYRYLFKETEKEIRYPVADPDGTFYLADLLSNINAKAKEGFFLKQPFQLIGRNFRVFDQDTTDILVPFGNGGEIAEQLISMQDGWSDFGKLREIMGKAKKYTIGIYEWQKEKLYQAGLLSEVLDGRAWVLDGKAYDDCFGLTVAEEQAVDHFVL